MNNSDISEIKDATALLKDEELKWWFQQNSLFWLTVFTLLRIGLSTADGEPDIRSIYFFSLSLLFAVTYLIEDAKAGSIFSRRASAKAENISKLEPLRIQWAWAKARLFHLISLLVGILFFELVFYGLSFLPTIFTLYASFAIIVLAVFLIIRWHRGTN